MDARELRRKVILARIGVAVVAVLILIGVIVANWSGSESGVVGRAEFSLQSDHSQKNMLECLDSAERFAREGKKASAAKIEEAVYKALHSTCSDGQSFAKAELELAQELKKRGDNKYAFEYAFKSLATVKELFEREKKKEGIGVGSLALMMDTVDGASSLILQLKKTLDTTQLNTALAIADAEAAYIVRDGKDRILDVCIDSISKNAVPPTDESVRCFFNKDLILAQRGQIPELTKMLARTTEIVGRLQDPTTIRPNPQPCLLEHLIAVSSAIKNNPMAASKFLSSAEDILNKIDRSKLADDQKLVLTGCLMRMSRACLLAEENEKALAYAKESVFLRPLQDAASANCVNQLLSVLVASNKFSQAEGIASSTYKFYKANSNNTDMLVARGEFIAQYFPILVGLQKNTLAISIVNDEIKMQKKLLPASAQAIVDLNCRLADYYIKRNLLRAATECARRMAEIARQMPGEDRLRLNMLLISYATKTKTPDLAAKASTDALSYINKNRRSNIAPEWIDGLCSALDAIKKSDSEESYKQALELIKTGFVQQLSNEAVDPALLAKVVNTLGTSGEEREADALRSEAKDRLPAAKATAFLSQSMDFVVNGEQDSAQYSEPKNAIKVYLDLAHSMQGKNDEDAFKNAFEALKIIHVLAGKNSDLPEDLLATIEDASGIMFSCRKQSPNDDQLKILTELSTMEADYMRKSGKGKLLDLTLTAQEKRHAVATDSLLSLMFLRDEILAKRGQLGMLDAQVRETRDALAELNPNGMSSETSINMAKHLLEISDELSQHQNGIAARRYLGMTKKILEDLAAEQASQMAAYTQASKAAEQAKADPAAQPNANAELPSRPPVIDRVRTADMWNRMSSLYAKTGDSQSALACARKAVSLRPMQDAGTARASLNLVDRLIDTGNYAEAEPVALEVYRFCKGRPSADYMSLRFISARKLIRTERELHKDAIVDSIVNEEFAALKELPPAQAVYANDLYNEIANYFVMHQDANSAAECINRIQQNKALMRPEQRAAWERSGAQLDLLVLTLRIRNPKLASDVVSELANYRGLDKTNAIKTPLKWWPNALSTFKKSGDEKAYGQVLSLVKGSFLQQLAKPDSDPASLGDMLTELNSLGATDAAVALRDQAEKRLADANRESFLAHCKGLPAEAPKPESEGPDGGKTAEQKDNSGRIDEGD